MLRQIFGGHGLGAAWTLAELGPALTLAQQVLCEAGDLHHLEAQLSFTTGGRKDESHVLQPKLRGLPVCIHHSVSASDSVSSSAGPGRPR